MKFQSSSHRLTKTARVINEVVSIIQKSQRPLTTSEILMRLHVSLGTFWNRSRNQTGLLSAMLNNESKRKYARVVKVGRGFYLIPALLPKFEFLFDETKYPHTGGERVNRNSRG